MLKVGLLGATQISDGGTPLPPPPAMPRALLALVSLRAGTPVHMDAAIDALWGDAPPDTARNAVQVYVSTLRRLLGKDTITSASGGYLLDSAVLVDVMELESAIAAYRQHPADPRAASAVNEAMALWRGEPLSDVTAPFAEAQRARARLGFPA